MRALSCNWSHVDVKLYGWSKRAKKVYFVKVQGSHVLKSFGLECHIIIIIFIPKFRMTLILFKIFYYTIQYTTYIAIYIHKKCVQFFEECAKFYGSYTCISFLCQYRSSIKISKGRPPLIIIKIIYSRIISKNINPSI